MPVLRLPVPARDKEWRCQLLTKENKELLFQTSERKNLITKVFLVYSKLKKKKEKKKTLRRKI